MEKLIFLLIEKKAYEHQHGKTMSTPAVANFLANLLYYKRFFPYYSFNVLGGIDENGEGCCYSYDAVGSHERSPHASSGSGRMLIDPFLDNQVFFTDFYVPPKLGKQEKSAYCFKSPTYCRGCQGTYQTTSSFLTYKAVVRDALCSAAERDIHTGDYADMFVVTKEGVQTDKFILKLD